MLDLTFDPSLPGKLIAAGFLQTIRASAKGKEIGTARWHARPGEGDGVVQLLELSVTPEKMRQGVGNELFGAVVAQSSRYYTLRKSRLRRIWVMVDQKTQVNARAFMNDHGFHHVASVPNLLSNQDALIYSLAVD